MGIVGAILAFIGFIVMLIGWIFVLIAAFKDKVTKGLLCLFLLPYAIFYVFARYKPDNKQLAIILFIGGLGVLIVGYIIMMAFAAPVVMY